MEHQETPVFVEEDPTQEINIPAALPVDKTLIAGLTAASILSISCCVCGGVATVLTQYADSSEETSESENNSNLFESTRYPTNANKFNRAKTINEFTKFITVDKDGGADIGSQVFYYYDISIGEVCQIAPYPEWEKTKAQKGTAWSQYRDEQHDLNRENSNCSHIDKEKDHPIAFRVKNKPKIEQLNRNFAKYGPRVERTLDLVINKSSLPFFEKVRAAGLQAEFKQTVIGQIAVESSYNPYAASSANAKGIIQIIPNILNRELNRICQQDKLLANHKSYKGRVQANPAGIENDIIMGMCNFQSLYDEFQNGVSKLNGNATDFFNSEANFKNIVLPLLFTGYNQGKGRLAGASDKPVALLQLFWHWHQEDMIPASYYQNASKEELNEDAFFYFIHQAALHNQFQETIKRDRTEEEESFDRNNNPFLTDGFSYYIKSLAFGKLLATSDFNSDLDVDPNWFVSGRNKRLDQGELKRIIERDPRARYGTTYFDRSEIITEAELTDDQAEFVIFSKHSIRQPERRALPNNTFDTYLEFAQKAKALTGKAPIITSTCRESRPSNGSHTSFHFNCMAVDLSVRNYSQQELDVIFQLLTEMSLQGKLTVRHERHPEHIHIVLIPPSQQNKLKEYINGTGSAQVQKERHISNPVYSITNPHKHCRVSYISHRKREECVS